MKYKYDEFKWFIGRNIEVPDKLRIEWGDNLKVECIINWDNWNFENPVYHYLCDYEDGNIEKVSIPLETIIESSIYFKKEFNDKYRFDDIEWIIEGCILNKLKLIDNYEYTSLEN